MSTCCMRMAFLPSCLSPCSFSGDCLEGRRLFSSFLCVEALARERVLVRVRVRALACVREYVVFVCSQLSALSSQLSIQEMWSSR